MKRTAALGSVALAVLLVSSACQRTAPLNGPDPGRSRPLRLLPCEGFGFTTGTMTIEPGTAGESNFNDAAGNRVVRVSWPQGAVAERSTFSVEPGRSTVVPARAESAVPTASVQFNLNQGPPVEFLQPVQVEISYGVCPGSVPPNRKLVAALVDVDTVSVGGVDLRRQMEVVFLVGHFSEYALAIP